jgi:GlpG protein
MFSIGELKDKNLAEELSLHLRKKGIENFITLNPQGNAFILLVSKEQDVQLALLEYNRAIGIRVREEIDPNWKKISEVPMGNITWILIIISALVFLISLMPNGMDKLSPLYFAGDGKEFIKEIRQGEIWRLVTPVFLHFGFLHVIFNLLWLKDLGKVLENKSGPIFFGILFIVIAILSNLAQYLTFGPKFGGMSGVVYGFLGQLWMNSTFNSNSEIKLPKHDVNMMIIWFFLCMFGLIGNIANMAHGVGLSIGMLFGIWSGIRASKGKVPFKKILGYLSLAIVFTALTMVVEYFKFGKELYIFSLF